MTKYNLLFGGGIRRSLNENFKEAKARHGIVTSLPMSMEPRAVKEPKAKPAPKQPSREMLDRYVAGIKECTDAFCAEYLNDEYAALCRKLADKLARKRPSPLLSGQPRGWVCGIIRTIGWVNFLHDQSQTPHMQLRDIDAALGVSESSGAAKLATIRKMLRIRQLDPRWTLASRRYDDPLDWIFTRGRPPF